MASAKLTCPECKTVLRPNKPVAPGKKVKCPKCETVFSAPPAEIEEVEEVEEVRPRKSATSKAAPAKPAKKEEKPAAKMDDEDDDGAATYGYIKEPEPTEEEKKQQKKEKIRYGPDTSVKDPRGPATVKLAGPTGKLQLAGSIGALGWLMLTLLIIFPAVFPIAEKDKEKLKNVEEKKAPLIPGEKPPPPKAKQPPFWTVYGFDFDKYIIQLPWYTFMAAMIPFLALACYCALIVSGGIKAQNLESRTWGIVGSVMAMIPLTSLGLSLLITIVIHWLVFQILEDEEFGMYISIVVNVLLWLVAAGIGGWTLKTLMDEEVQEGFTYEPE
jgi:predicted Zn finger-like uncharacterized protein